MRRLAQTCRISALSSWQQGASARTSSRTRCSCSTARTCGIGRQRAVSRAWCRRAACCPLPPHFRRQADSTPPRPPRGLGGCGGPPDGRPPPGVVLKVEASSPGVLLRPRGFSFGARCSSGCGLGASGLEAPFPPRGRRASSVRGLRAVGTPPACGWGVVAPGWPGGCRAPPSGCRLGKKGRTSRFVHVPSAPRQ